MNKSTVRKRLFKYFNEIDGGIKTKFSNLCGKTGQYNVPVELYQKRTARKNRVLISWASVFNNNMTFEQLDSFEGGVVVEFINNDFFDDSYKDNELYNILRKRLGSDENVSAMISIRSQDGSSSSSIQRESFKKLTSNCELEYNNSSVVITKRNYKRYKIKKNIQRQNRGNHVWSGFLYISIKGGQQDTIETHKGEKLWLFNPACEYASADVCEDINLSMGYYALVSINEQTLSELTTELQKEYPVLKEDVEQALKEIEYDCDEYKGNLYDFIIEQYPLTLYKNQLTDPIQLKQITIEMFSNKTRTEDSLDVTHNEAVILEKYHWDKNKKTMLSPARPTNIFWSLHLSNMMQQNYSIDDYIEFEENRVKKRKKLIENE